MQLARTRHGVLFGIILCGGFALSFLLASPAWAHFTEVARGSWREGLAHPFSGLDHLVAMTAMGLWATQMGRPALWLLPTSFLMFMTAGAGLSLAGIVLPGAEDGIAVSVAVLGVLLAVAARPGPVLGAAIAALFGIVHGYGHGAEMPEAAAPLLYGLGFLMATAALQLVGIGVGLLARSPIGQRVLPIGAAAIVGIGVTLMLAL